MMSSIFAASTVDADSEYGQRILATRIFPQLFFKQPVDIAKIRAVLAKFLEFDRFRSVFQQGEDGTETTYNLGKVYCRELAKEEVDMEYHVVDIDDAEDVPIVGPWDSAKVSELASWLYTHPHSKERPLWRFYVIQNMEDGRSLLFGDIDHSIGDGLSLVNCLLSLLEVADEGTRPHPKKRDPTQGVGILTRIAAAVSGTVRGILGSALPADVPNALKLKDPRNPTRAKTSASSPPIPLSEVKQMQKLVPGATVNTVLCALSTMVLRKYYEEVGDPIIAKKQNIRASFPIGTSKGQELHNLFVTGKLTFDLHYKDPVELLNGVLKQTQWLKNSPEAHVEAAIGRMVLPRLPEKAAVDTLMDLPSKTTCMLSNVMGPQQEAVLAGHVVDDISYFTATPGWGLYFGIISYNGKVTATCTCDPTCCGKPVEICKYWVPCWEELRTACRELDGGRNM